MSLPAAVLASLEQQLHTSISSVHAIGGGDINEARLLETPKGRFFLKMNSHSEALRMFQTEAQGLQDLAKADVIRIPTVLLAGEAGGTAFLVLEYIASGRATDNFWQIFGERLARLHKHTHPTFGLSYDNFIGRLPQPNKPTKTWPEFFIEQRILPQLHLARQQHRITPQDEARFEQLFKKLPNLFPSEPPALTHGDLWSGNYIVDSHQQPVLIDPALSYAHREMDLAMTHLFGGFAPRFYESYQATYPLESDFENRVSIYQLYYLLVHVVLFGGGYINSVRSILQRFQ